MQQEENSSIRLVNYSDIFETEITAEIAQQQLQDLYSSPSIGNISIKNIMEVVAENYQISIADLKSKKRDKKFVHPRHIALYIAKELTEYTFSDLGNEFGGRDHSSIMHACDKVKEQIKEITTPPTKPSQVFLGEILGFILCFPKRIPVQ